MAPKPYRALSAQPSLGSRDFLATVAAGLFGSPAAGGGNVEANAGTSLTWADLREDKLINEKREDEIIKLAPGFRPIFGPSGPTAGPGSHGTGSGSKDSAGCTKNQPRRPVLRPVRGYFVFVVPAAKI